MAKAKTAKVTGPVTDTAEAALATAMPAGIVTALAAEADAIIAGGAKTERATETVRAVMAYGETKPSRTALDAVLDKMVEMLAARLDKKSSSFKTRRSEWKAIAEIAPVTFGDKTGAAIIRDVEALSEKKIKRINPDNGNAREVAAIPGTLREYGVETARWLAKRDPKSGWDGDALKALVAHLQPEEATAEELADRALKIIKTMVRRAHEQKLMGKLTPANVVTLTDAIALLTSNPFRTVQSGGAVDVMAVLAAAAAKK